MKIACLLLLLSFANIVVGQTENHKPVSGTKYSIIPPKGFVTSTTFSGFQNNELNASIMVTEIPTALQAISEGFTADALKTRGMTLIDKQPIDYNNSKATFIKLSQQANGTTYFKQILLFGDDKKTVMINGIYPETNKSIEADLKTSLLSTSYNENQNDNPFDAVKFKIDVSGTDFKVAKYIAGSLLYTTDGKVPTEKSMLMVGSSVSKVTVDDKKQYSIDRFKALPGSGESKIKETNPIQIDGLEGYELIANRKKEAKDELVYQVMLFTTTGDYFIFVGTTTENPETNLASFKSIAKTFKRK